MIRGMYSAISGLKQHQIMLDVTSNNLANVNTVGYKAARTSFKDQLQQTFYGGSASGPNTGGTNAAQVGLGVQLASVDAVISRRLAAGDRQPARRRHPGRGLVPRRAGHAARPSPPPPR